jgi:hypothetical protein
MCKTLLIFIGFQAFSVGDYQIILGIIDQHFAVIITPLFSTPAPTCFGTYMPCSGSVLYPYELLERQKWLCCSHVL